MYYYSFNSYLKERFGGRVRRMSLNAGFSCPNKNGKGPGGCIFCNESAFSRFGARNVPLEDQINAYLKEEKDRKGGGKFIAYFQNATNTYAGTRELKEAYDVITKYPEIVSLCVSTRPDSINDEKIDLIAGYSPRYEVWVEYGVQTIHDRSLRFLKRGHTFRQSRDAILKTAQKGLKVGVHLILGLPGETAGDIVETAKVISSLPVSGVKLHVLQVLKGTELADMYSENKIKVVDREEYVDLVCDFLENLRSDCVILRLVSDADKDLLIAPKWTSDKARVIKEIENEFAKRETRQGIKCEERG